MNIKRIHDLYNLIKDRLPSTYPKARLAFFENEEHMLERENMKVGADESVYAIVDPDTSTISLPLKMTFEYTAKDGQIYNKVVSIDKISDEEICHTLLHESFHLLMGERYGYSSKQYSDEKGCDKFGERWVKKMKKEKLI